MANQINGNQFREDEIVIMAHFDEKEEKWTRNIYPKVGGRLRLAHEDNQQLSISSSIIKFDGEIAVVMAVTTTSKGSFPGYGMASLERDKTIAPAILELAETRAIARSLRFAGYGVEYCSAEEISHLQNGSEPLFGAGPRVPESQEDDQKGGDEGDSGYRQDEKGNGRISSKQYKYILNLIQDRGMTKRELNEQCRNEYGKVLDHLSRAEASEVITELLN